jgi:tRNA(Ile)-lysidine synthase
LIWQTSQLLAAEEEVLQTQEELAWQETVLSSTATSVGINLEKFRQLPQAIRRRIIRRAWSALYPDFTELEFSHVETVIQTLLAPRVSRRKISKWLICLRDYEQGYLLKPGVFPSAWEYPQLQKDEVLSLPLSGSLRINKEWVLQTKLICEHLEEVTRQGRMNRFEAWLDFEVCKKGMYVRPPRAGDRFAPLSMEGKTKKLSDLFIDCKIPFWLRRSFPLICNEAEILWVPGYTISHWARITPATRQALHLELVHLRSETENSGGEH